MTEMELKSKIEECSNEIAKSLHRGKDVEIRKSSTGISAAEVSKKVVHR